MYHVSQLPVCPASPKHVSAGTLLELDLLKILFCNTWPYLEISTQLEIFESLSLHLQDRATKRHYNLISNQDSG